MNAYLHRRDVSRARRNATSEELRAAGHATDMRTAASRLVDDYLLNCRCPQCGEYWYWSKDGRCGGCGTEANIYSEVS